MLGNLAKVIVITCGLGVFIYIAEWGSLPEVLLNVLVLLVGIGGFVKILQSYEP